MADKDDGYMRSDAKEVLNVARGLIETAKVEGATEVQVEFFQTHMNDQPTKVSVRIRL